MNRCDASNAIRVADARRDGWVLGKCPLTGHLIAIEPPKRSCGKARWLWCIPDNDGDLDACRF